MAIRQYIGARYVLKIYENSLDPNSADWESGVAYEPLVMVNYNNSSYISRKDVPANIGNPVDNPSYWALSGLYNGQIAQLQQDILDLQHDLGIAENEIEELQQHKAMKLAIVTDSYGNTFSNTIVPFTQRIADYTDFVIGENYCFAQYDGAGFVSDGRKYDTAINSLYNNMPNDMDPDEITDFLILGGCNDRTVASGIPAAMSNTISLVKSLFPNAKIHIGVIGGIADLTGRVNIAENVVPTYLNCAALGAVPLQNLQYIMTNKSYFQLDGTHPNQDGMNAIARGVISAINNGFRSYYKATTPTFTKDAAFDSGIVGLKVKQNNEQLVISTTANPYFAYPSNTNISAGNITLGTFTDDIFIGNVNNIFMVQVTFYGTDAGTFILPVTFSGGTFILINDKARTVSGFTMTRFMLTCDVMEN